MSTKAIRFRIVLLVIEVGDAESTVAVPSCEATDKPKHRLCSNMSMIEQAELYTVAEELLWRNCEGDVTVFSRSSSWLEASTSTIIVRSFTLVYGFLSDFNNCYQIQDYTMKKMSV